MPHACGAAKAGCSTALFSRQAGNTSLSESMKESEGSEVSQALTAASAKAPDDDEPASDAAVAGSSSESRPESMHWLSHLHLHLRYHPRWHRH